MDFYLRVYDLTAKGKPYSVIAKEVKRPLSTVKSADLIARRNIFGPGKEPSKRDAALGTFDPDRHFLNCPICHNAETSDEMCDLVKLCINQGTRGQRESTGYDTIRG